uniref:Uncharacterized protein n=1 Tax=Gouania willdenowi TaxID=441366 RepID=A0A8C5G1W8_GOUWI
MGIQTIWNNYKVLIVMGTSIGLIHWGWFHLKSNPLLHQHRAREEPPPEPGIISYVSPPDTTK